MAEGELRRYRFGPLERRGLVGALRPVQVFMIAGSLAGAVILMRTLAAGAGVFAAVALVLAALAFCFWPIAGRSAEEWLPIAGRYGRRRANGKHRYRSFAPATGVAVNGSGRPEPVVSLPEPAA
ncbi:MAG: hypothetical protein ACRDM1_03200, partial [Gaiellaceae bacterium]